MAVTPLSSILRAAQFPTLTWRRVGATTAVAGGIFTLYYSQRPIRDPIELKPIIQKPIDFESFEGSLVEDWPLFSPPEDSPSHTTSLAEWKSRVLELSPQKFRLQNERKKVEDAYKEPDWKDDIKQANRIINGVLFTIKKFFQEDILQENPNLVAATAPYTWQNATVAEATLQKYFPKNLFDHSITGSHMNEDLSNFDLTIRELTYNIQGTPEEWFVKVDLVTTIRFYDGRPKSIGTQAMSLHFAHNREDALLEIDGIIPNESSFWSSNPRDAREFSELGAFDPLG